MLASVPNLKFAVSPIRQGMRDSPGLWPGGIDGESATGSLGAERERTRGAEIASGSTQHGAGLGAAGADRAGLHRRRAEQAGGSAGSRLIGRRSASGAGASSSIALTVCRM